MKILVDNLKKDNDRNLVSFKSQVGKGMGIYETSHIELEKGRCYDAELDINIDFEWLVYYPSNDIYELNVSDEYVMMSGSIEDIEDDMVYFRLSQDCLIMIGAERKPSLEVHSFIQLIVPIINVKVSIFCSP